MSNIRNKFEEFCDKISNRNVTDEEIILSYEDAYLTMKSNYCGDSLLHLTAGSGRYNLMIFLLEKQISINEVDVFGLTALMLACAGGHDECVKMLMSKGADVNVKDYEGRSALDIAIRKGHFKYVESLISNGADVNVKDYGGRSALDYAIRRGHFKYVESLISNGADVNLELLNKETPNQDELFKCAAEDNEIYFKQHFKCPFHLFTKYPKTGETLYEVINQNKSSKIINWLQLRPITMFEKKIFHKLFIKKDPIFIRSLKENQVSEFLFPCYILELEHVITISNVNQRSCLNYKTPLQLSIEFNSRFILGGIYAHLEMKEEEINLLNNNIYLDSLENIDWTLLEELKYRKNYIVSLATGGYSQLHISLFENCVNRIIKILDISPETIEDGANTVGTPLFHCVDKENVGMIKAIMPYHPNLNYTDQSGVTLSQLAVIKSSDEIIDILVENNPDWNKKSKIEISKENSLLGNIDLKSRRILLQNELITNEETCLSLELKINRGIRHKLLSKLTLENIKNQDKNGESLLHISSSLCLVEPTELISLHFQEATSYRNNLGETALMKVVHQSINNKREALSGDMIEIIKTLTANSNQINNNQFYDTNGKAINLLEKLFEIEDERLLLEIIQLECAEFQVESSYIKLAFDKSYFEFLHQYWTESTKCLFIDIVTSDVFNSLYGIAPNNFLDTISTLFNEDDWPLISMTHLAVLWNLNKLEEFQIKLKCPQIKCYQLSTGETILTKMIKCEDPSALNICNQIIKEISIKELLINTSNQEGYLPIHVAVIYEKYELIQPLTSLIKDINAMDPNGDSAIGILIRTLNDTNEESTKVKLLDYIKILINSKAEIFLRGTNNKAPIEYYESNRSMRCKIEQLYFDCNGIKSVPSDSSSNVCLICRRNKVDCELLCRHKFCRICVFDRIMCPSCKCDPALPIQLI